MALTKGPIFRGRPAGTSRKPVPKEYGATSEYAMTAYERRRLERKGLLPTAGSSPRGDVPGAADPDATPAPDVAGHPAGDVHPFS